MLKKKESFSKYSEFVVQNQGNKQFLGLFIFIAGLLAGGLAGYFGGKYRFLDKVVLPGDVQQELETLRKEKKINDYDKQINKNAESLVREENKKLNEQIAELEGSITFYKNILQPTSVEQGVVVETLKLKPTASANRYSFHIVLTQNSEKYQLIRGNISFEVTGDFEGQKTLLSMADVAISKKNYFDFKYRYFQEFNDEVELPNGFLPEQVRIAVSTRSPARENKDVLFDWVLSDQ